jgi:S-adenosylmethionine:tRNA ribosyltransferase-isomerase
MGKGSFVMKVEEFDYELPERLIAQKPLINRTDSRLLVLKRDSGQIYHRRFTDLVEYLKAGDVLVLNDSKVIPARLMGRRKDTEGRVEVLLLTPLGQDEWEVLVKPGKRLRPGATVIFGQGQLQGEILKETSFGGRVIKFLYQGDFQGLLQELGQTPLPPYIKEELQDADRYQTVYAKTPGSAAAPTAGLHFTPVMLQRLQDLGVEVVFFTLHIGLGTFRPVEAANVEDHPMHKEFFVMPAATAEVINRKRSAGGRLVAVGTTACRTLETCAGADGKVEGRSGWTDLFIYPGYAYKVVDALLTNFHLPKSTLIMLVSALAGTGPVKRAYAEAVEMEYRFYSFGDAMLIL